MQSSPKCLGNGVDQSARRSAETRAINAKVSKVHEDSLKNRTGMAPGTRTIQFEVYRESHPSKHG